MTLILTNKQKKSVVAKLRHEFESQRFHDFYTGPMDYAITGEFERGAEKYVANEAAVEEYLNRLVDSL